MKILIFGGNGMIGHHFLRYWQARHDVRVTVRQSLATYESFGIFTKKNTYPDVDVRNDKSIRHVFSDFHPEVVVNAIGIVKQVITPALATLASEINAVFPHRLAEFCGREGARLIQLSTDCVFSGKKGMYTESDPTDGEDIYGKTKARGELYDGNCLTIRKSVIGREIATRNGLLEWFLSQKGSVKGFTKAIYSGLTIMELSRVIEKIIIDFPNARGLYHVSSEPISKYNLLRMIQKAFGLSTAIIPDDTFVCDRSLDSTAFRKAFHYTPPSWEAMVQELAQESRDF